MRAIAPTDEDYHESMTTAAAELETEVRRLRIRIISLTTAQLDEAAPPAPAPEEPAPVADEPVPEDRDLHKMTVAQLRSVARGLNTGLSRRDIRFAKKEELIARIEQAQEE